MTERRHRVSGMHKDKIDEHVPIQMDNDDNEKHVSGAGSALAALVAGTRRPRDLLPSRKDKDVETDTGVPPDEAPATHVEKMDIYDFHGSSPVDVATAGPVTSRASRRHTAVPSSLQLPTAAAADGMHTNSASMATREASSKVVRDGHSGSSLRTKSATVSVSSSTAKSTGHVGRPRRGVLAAETATADDEGLRGDGGLADGNNNENGIGIGNGLHAMKQAHSVMDLKGKDGVPWSVSRAERAAGRRRSMML